VQQHAGKQIGEDYAGRPREQPQDNELYAENGRNGFAKWRPVYPF
jgi:hypothetical protein